MKQHRRSLILLAFTLLAAVGAAIVWFRNPVVPCLDKKVPRHRATHAGLSEHDSVSSRPRLLRVQDDGSNAVDDTPPHGRDEGAQVVPPPCEDFLARDGLAGYTSLALTGLLAVATTLSFIDDERHKRRRRRRGARRIKPPD